jgi:hypothetical protein
MKDANLRINSLNAATLMYIIYDRCAITTLFNICISNNNNHNIGLTHKHALHSDLKQWLKTTKLYTNHYNNLSQLNKKFKRILQLRRGVIKT